METQKNRGKEADLKKDSASKQDVSSKNRTETLGKKSSPSTDRSSGQRDEKQSDENRDLGRKPATDKNAKR